MVGHRDQHGVDVGPGEDFAEVIVGQHAVVAGLAELLGVDLVAARSARGRGVPCARRTRPAPARRRARCSRRAHKSSRRRSRWPLPWPPRPMKPMLMRSLGAVAPSRPRADAGMRVGAASVRPRAMEDRRRNCRRRI